MHRTNIERFLADSQRHLMGPDDHDKHIPKAARLLVAEFMRAVAIGPDAPLSAPENMRDAQTTLAHAVSRMLDDEPTLLIDLLVELKHGTRDDVLEFLASTYAAWVIASYDLGAFKS